MSPHDIFAAFAESDSLPRRAMVAAGKRREEMVPIFLDYIAHLQDADIDTVSEADTYAFLFVYFLLGEWREARAYRPLTALLRKDPKFLELLLGDAITEGTKRIIAGVFDGDLQPILEVIEDPAAYEFARCEMIDALAMIARLHPETRPEVAAYLEGFFASEFEKEETLWGAWAFAVAELGLAHLEPQVQQAFEQEWISPQEADFAYFQEQLRIAMAGGQLALMHGSGNHRLIDSAVKELSGWYCFSDKYLKENAFSTALPQISGGTVESAAPKVGRNDPCPCGSGKKYKKCCLA